MTMLRLPIQPTLGRRDPPTESRRKPESSLQNFTEWDEGVGITDALLGVTFGFLA